MLKSNEICLSLWTPSVVPMHMLKDRTGELGRKAQNSVFIVSTCVYVSEDVCTAMPAPTTMPTTLSMIDFV